VNASIRVLDVTDNRIGPVGVKHLLKGLLTRSGHIGGFTGFVCIEQHHPEAPKSAHVNPFKLFEPKVREAGDE